jgi:hypothetical protein
MRFGSDRAVALDRLFCRLGVALVMSTLAVCAQAQNQCSATGLMGGQKFLINHCAAAVYSSQHSVAIWFNEDPITAEEAADFRATAAVDTTKNGKQRTLLMVMFCPGGGAAKASPTAVKSMRLTTNHAKSLLAGIQWNVKAPKDFKVQTLNGEVQPGGNLVGQIIGSWRKTTWNITFDVKLPATDSATGMSCGH